VKPNFKNTAALFTLVVTPCVYLIGPDTCTNKSVSQLKSTVFTTFEVFAAVKIQVVVFWVVRPCSDVVGYRRFGGICCLRKVLLNVGILPQHYTMS
jgi:hypothetical protein